MLMETDIRSNILQSILQSPHGEISNLSKLHTEALTTDPLFYAHFACWYFDKGVVRDHKRLFISRLLTAPLDYKDFRQLGNALFDKLSTREAAKAIKEAKIYFKGAPRFLKSATECYLRVLENNYKVFDSVAVQNRSSLKSLYASEHIKPSPRAQAILFDKNPPPGSMPYITKNLKNASPEEAARLIVGNAIPFLTAVGAVKKVTPTISIALINNMTSQQLLNNLSAIEKRGLLQDEEVRELIDKKLHAAKEDKRVATFKMDLAADKSVLKERITQIRDQRIEQSAKITKSTALFIDKSGSMEGAIDIGKRIAAMIAPIIADKLYVITFDSVAKLIHKPESNDMRDWENAFKYINAHGQTSIGSALRLLMSLGETEQIIIVTDGKENDFPYFADVYEELKSKPSVIVVYPQNPSHDNFLAANLKVKRINYSEFNCNGDYYSLPNLLPMLTHPGLQELVMEIMEYPLPIFFKF